MEQIQACEKCPALHTGMVKETQLVVDEHRGEFMQIGEKLDGYLVMPQWPEAETVELARRERIAQRSIRIIGLTMMYLSQIESSVRYANSLECSKEVQLPSHCPKVKAVIFALDNLNKAMGQDIQDIIDI